MIALRTGNTTDVLLDEDGEALVPSAVYFMEGGSVLVGRAALEHQHSDPSNLVYNAKRFIGRARNDSAVTEQESRYEFDVVENRTASTSGAWFRLTNAGQPPSVSPETVGSAVPAHTPTPKPVPTLSPTLTPNLNRT